MLEKINQNDIMHYTDGSKLVDILGSNYPQQTLSEESMWFLCRVKGIYFQIESIVVHYETQPSLNRIFARHLTNIYKHICLLATKTVTGSSTSMPDDSVYLAWGSELLFLDNTSIYLSLDETLLMAFQFPFLATNFQVDVPTYVDLSSVQLFFLAFPIHSVVANLLTLF